METETFLAGLHQPSPLLILFLHHAPRYPAAKARLLKMVPGGPLVLCLVPELPLEGLDGQVRTATALQAVLAALPHPTPPRPAGIHPVLHQHLEATENNQ